MRRHGKVWRMGRIGMLGLGVAVALPLLSVVGASAGETPMQLPQIQGLEDPNTFVPADNPLTKEKVELGRILFFDKRLSKNNTIACASCHLAEKGFADGMPVSTGINGLIFLGSPCKRCIALRIAARSTTAGTPVKSWSTTRAGLN